jgi:hypothetical protein
MRTKLLVTMLAGLLTASAAHGAECPNAEEAKRGFTLERPDVRSQFRPSAEMVVHVENTFDRSAPQTQFFFGGLIEVFRNSETGRFAMFPLSDLRSIFPLKPDARHELAFLRLAPREKAAIPETLELQVLGKETFSLGQCKYDVLVVKQSVKGAEGKETTAWTSLYSPDLQAVLAKRYEEGTAQEETIGYEEIKPLEEE